MVALAGEYQGNTTEAISEPCVSTTTTSDIVDEVRVVKEHKTTNPLPRWWIPVPLVIVMMASTVTDHVLLNDLFIKRYRYEYHISTASSFPYNTQCMLRNTSEIDSIIQEKTAHLNVILGWSGIGPALVAYVLLGANCDLIGRRPLIIIPFIGKVIRYVLLMVFITFNWSDRWLISAHVIDNVFGSSAVMMLGALSYISDCTTEKTRSRAFLIQEIVGALTHFFTLLGLGFWLQGHGYVLPVAISLCMNSAALLYAGFFQPESRVLESVWRQLKRIRLRSVLGTYRVFLVKRPGYHQQYIILLTFAHIILFLTHISFISIHPLYLYGRPFCFTALGLAILTSGHFGLVIPILLAFSLYQRQLDTPLLPLVSTSFYIVHIALFGAAKQVVTLYVAGILGAGLPVALAVLRCQITKLVNDSEFALVFIVTGILQTAGSHVVMIMTNQIYKTTLRENSSLIFYIQAGFAAFPLSILVYMATVSVSIRKRQTNTIDDEDTTTL